MSNAYDIYYNKRRRKFVCPECSFATSYASALGTHRWREHGVQGTSPASLYKRQSQNIVSPDLNQDDGHLKNGHILSVRDAFLPSMIKTPVPSKSDLCLIVNCPECHMDLTAINKVLAESYGHDVTSETRLPLYVDCCPSCGCGKLREINNIIIKNS